MAWSCSIRRHIGSRQLANFCGRRFDRAFDRAGLRRDDLFRLAATQQGAAMMCQLGWALAAENVEARRKFIEDDASES